jgi:Secretion system C-terminal sorting domain
MKKVIICVLALMCGDTMWAQQVKKAVHELSQQREEDEEEGERTGAKTTCGGVERWSVKVLVDAQANTVNYTPIQSSIASLVTLTTPTPSASMARYAGVEDKTYTVTCNIYTKRDEDDNDYHLVLSDGTNTIIGEVPDPVCSQAASSAHVNEYISARNFVNTYIPTPGTVYPHIGQVVVTGVAFVDPPHGQSGKAPNNLELHPILNIHFASEGVNTVEEKLSVQVTPNPFVDYLNVTIESKEVLLNHTALQLYNSMGNKVNEYILHATNKKEVHEKIQIGALPQGVYIYRIVNDGKLLYDGKLSVK